MSKYTAQIISGLLFSHPLFDYYIEKNEKKYLPVLIVGDSCTENSDLKVVFSRVFNCGQMSEDYLLCVTIASPDPKNIEKQFYNMMPGLKTLKSLFSSEIKFVKIDDVYASDYRYIILAGEDNNINKALFEKFSSQIKNKSILLCMFGCDRYNCFDRNIYQFVDENNTQQNDILKLEELNRYAYNCDFAYAQNLNEREPFKPKPELSDSFFTDTYNHIRSLAFVTHIPYKLKICENKTDEFDSVGIELLLDIIKGKSDEYRDIYNKLLAIEHRRWCADLISEGWSMPDDKQLQKTFTNENKQKISSEKLHPCLCEGTDSGCLLSEHYELWDECKEITTLKGVKEYIYASHPGLKLSDLEMISLALYAITNDRVKTLCKDTNNLEDLFEFTNTNQLNEEITDSLNWLHNSVNRLRDEIPNSESLYRRTLLEVKEVAPDVITDALKNVEKNLEIIAERNRCKNYFTIDEAMIDMIPFMMWYGKEYKKVIVVSNGLATEDVIVPTMLYPEETVFIGNFKSNGYEAAISNYFKNRHVNFENTTNNRLKFINANGNICQGFESELTGEIKTNNTVVALSLGIDAKDVVGICSLIGNDIPLVEYSNKSIAGIKNANKRFGGLLSKSFSVNEYISLLQGELEKKSKFKEYNEIPDKEQFTALMDLYKTHTANNGDKTSHAWGKVSQSVRDGKNIFDNDNTNELNDKTVLVNSLIKEGLIIVDESIIKFKNDKIKNIFCNPGKMLELYIYYKAKISGLFSDVQQGQEFKWDCQGKICVNNEIDIIMINGMTPIFVSCKDKAFKYSDFRADLYEIHGVAEHYNAIPVLAITSDLYKSTDINVSAFFDRAKALGVYVLGRDIIFDDNKLLKAFETIKSGKALS